MNPVSRKEFSCISKNYYKEKTTIVYDEESKRVIEKIISEVHPFDQPNYYEKSKIQYIYDLYSNIISIIEISKDYNLVYEDNSWNAKKKVIFSGERAFVISRSFKKINYSEFKSGREYADVQYTERNRVSVTSKPNIDFVLRLEMCTTKDNKKKIVRVYSKIDGDQYYEYKYSKSNPEELLMINRYNIIVNLSFLSNIFPISPIFIKFKAESITTDLPNGVEIANEEKHIDWYRLLPLAYMYLKIPEIVVHESVNKEDIFILEKETIMKQIENYENKKDIE